MTQNVSKSQVVDEVVRLRSENERLRELLGKSNARVQQLEARLKWERRLLAIPSDSLSDGQKILALLLPDIERAARARETTDTARDDGLTRVDCGDAAKLSGKSADSVGVNFKRLDEAGLVEYRVERGRRKSDGEVRNASFIRTTEALKRLEVRTMERNRGNGQKHFICPSCRGTHTKVRRVYEVTCTDCGTISHIDPMTPEGHAFIVDDATFAHWDEWYGEVSVNELAVEEERVEPEPVMTPEPVVEVKPAFIVHPSFPAPDRPCIVCGETNWAWNGTGWYCAAHMEVEA